MSLTLEELKELHDKAYVYNQITRERGSDAILFYWVNQWDDNLLNDSQLAYRGEFNIIRKAGRQIIAELEANPVQVNFEPKAESREDGADLIDGLYLSGDRINTSIEAYDNAAMETVACGVGGWELYTEYESNRAGNRNQVIRRKPIYEYNNNCFMDPNAKRLDKSDAIYGSILEAYSWDGYKALVKELTDEEIEGGYGQSFSWPEHSYTFPWATGGNNPIIYVASFYYRELVKDKVLYMLDSLGEEVVYRKSDLSLIMDELTEQGFTVESERNIERWEVTKYIASGVDILSEEVISGENIPIVPMYGERAMVEGEEHYEGITQLAMDPQRLRNFQLSYLADIVSRSPRNKPIFFPEQIQGFEDMYKETGADNNFPYYLQNRVDANNNPLPVGPVAEMPEQKVPTSLMTSLNESRLAVDDVAGASLPNDFEDIELSGKAISLLEKKLDRQSAIYQKNIKHAKRRDAEVYASMASDVYDAPREVTLTLPDGSTNKISIMESVMDEESGEMVVINDLTGVEFDVFAKIGPSYSSKRDQTIEQLLEMAGQVAQTDPAMHKMLMLKVLTLSDGVNTEDVREYANKQLILSGFKAPETDEEIAMAEQAQQSKEPDPAMVLAMAEMKKGDAELAETQRKAIADQYKAQTDQGDHQVDVFEAQTKRAEVEVKAHKAGADIRYTDLKSQGQQIDNVQKLTAPFRARIERRPA